MTIAKVDRAEVLGDRADMLRCRVVAADIYARQSVAGEHEAGDWAGHRLASGRAMAGRDAGNPQRRAAAPG